MAAPRGARSTSGGNPGASPGDAVDAGRLLTAFSTYQGAAYDPVVQGPIHLIDFAEDCIALPGVLGVGPLLLIEQDGRRYAAGGGAFCDESPQRLTYVTGQAACVAVPAPWP